MRCIWCGAVVSPPVRIIMAFCRVLTSRELHVLRSWNNLRPYIHALRRGKSKQTHPTAPISLPPPRTVYIYTMYAVKVKVAMSFVYICHVLYILYVRARQRVSSVLSLIYIYIRNALILYIYLPKSDFARNTSTNTHTHTGTILFVTSHTSLISRAAKNADWSKRGWRVAARCSVGAYARPEYTKHGWFSPVDRWCGRCICSSIAVQITINERSSPSIYVCTASV